MRCSERCDCLLSVSDFCVCAASRDADGWTAEFRIPLSQLRYAADRETQEWGLQFGRTHFRTGEESFWNPMSPDEDGMVSQFGTLRDLRGLRPPRQLEIMPYVASALTRAPGDAADPFYSSNDLEPRVGLDVKYGLTSDLTLTATVNPDFGQVDIAQAVEVREEHGPGGVLAGLGFTFRRRWRRLFSTPPNAGR